MLKVKKAIRNPKNKSQNDDLTELQNNIKNSIKKLYISDQKKKKTINDNTELLTKIRNEYAKLKKKNNELRSELHKYQIYFQNMPQKSNQKPSYKKPIRKESTTIMMNLNKVKKVILMLQKFEDVLKNKKREYYTKFK